MWRYFENVDNPKKRKKSDEERAAAKKVYEEKKEEEMAGSTIERGWAVRVTGIR